MVDLSIVNKESLEFLGACKKGKEWFLRNIGTLPVSKINEIEDDYEDYIGWLKDNYPVSIDGMKHTFRDGSVSTYNKNGNEISYINSNGFKYTKTYNENGNILSYDNSRGFSQTRTYNNKGNELTYIDSDGLSRTWTYDDKGNALSHTQGDERDDYKYIISDEFFIMIKNDEEILRVPLK